MQERGATDTSEPRILVLRGGAIGDFILTLPVFQAIRRQWPRAYVEVAGYPHVAALAVEGGLADRVTSIDRSDMARFFSARPSIPDAQARYVKSFAFVLSYLYDPDGTVRENLLATGVRQVLYGTPRVEGGHAADHFMKPLESLAIYPEGTPCPRLDLREATRTGGRLLLERYGARVVVLHPGSGGKAKRWPLARFVALAAAIRRSGRAEAVFSIGEADDDVAAALRAAGEGDRLLEGLPLIELAGVLKAACGYVGNDSGITHLAAAVGAPVVALFGTTDPSVWGPRGGNVRIIRGAVDGVYDIAGTSVDEVFSAVRDWPAF